MILVVLSRVLEDEATVFRVDYVPVKSERKFRSVLAVQGDPLHSGRLVISRGFVFVDRLIAVVDRLISVFRIVIAVVRLESSVGNWQSVAGDLEA